MRVLGFCGRVPAESGLYGRDLREILQLMRPNAEAAVLDARPHREAYLQSHGPASIVRHGEGLMGAPSLR